MRDPPDKPTLPTKGPPKLVPDSQVLLRYRDKEPPLSARSAEDPTRVCLSPFSATGASEIPEFGTGAGVASGDLLKWLQP